MLPVLLVKANSNSAILLNREPNFPETEVDGHNKTNMDGNNGMSQCQPIPFSRLAGQCDHWKFVTTGDIQWLGVTHIDNSDKQITTQLSN